MTAEPLTYEVEGAEEGPSAVAAAKQPRSARPWVRTLCTDALWIAIGVLVVELTMQLLVPEYGHDYYDQQYTASHPVAFNTDGYRGMAVPIAKAPGELRIIGIGDSTTFGTGVGIEDTWPMQLRDMVAAGADRPVSAMNVGLQGASLADLSFAYTNHWADYHPDVVVAMVSGNMVSFGWMFRDVPPKMPVYIYPQNKIVEQGWHATTAKLKIEMSEACGHLCLPHFVSVNMQRALYWAGVLDHRIGDPTHPYGALLAHGWAQADLPRSEIDDAWQVTGRQLDELQQMTKAHAAKLIVAFSPCRFDLSNSLFDDEKNLPRDRLTVDPQKRLMEICQAKGITFVDVLPALRDARARLMKERGHLAPMYIMFDYNHLDHDGLHAVAVALMPQVLNSPAFAAR